MVWEESGSALKAAGEQLPVSANPFSLPCDIEAGLAQACTLAELTRTPADGRILLVYGDLARQPFSPRSWFLREQRDEDILQQLLRIQPPALLAPPTSTDYYNELTEDWELDLSAATVPAWVMRRLLQQPRQKVHLRIDAYRGPARARNIIGRTKGLGQDRLVICAHFDTKYRTPGASDNGGGTAALLALAERLASSPWQPGLEFVAFNGEEYLPIGDEEYIRLSQPYFDRIRACINMDGAGPALGSNSLTAFGATPEVEAALRAVLDDFPGVVWVEPWPESNHSTFAMRGIPAAAVSAVGVRQAAHSPEDTLEGMSAAKLEEVVDLVESVARVMLA
jgi:aminopeptidase YwaD